MPSPFPGMDPYLEAPWRWQGVHARLIADLQETLNRLVRPKYLTQIEERIYVSQEDDPGREMRTPDVRVIVSPKSRESYLPVADGQVAVAEPIITTTLLEEEIHEQCLRILDVHDRSVVTVIEVLSPTNKVQGSEGRKNYHEKRVEILNSPCHLVEIDLLRKGARFLRSDFLLHADYHVHVSKAEMRPKGMLWAIRLPQRLPVIQIPLRGNDPDVNVDLQSVFDIGYDRAGYDGVADYDKDPEPPLPPEHRQWAEELLRAKGLRP